MMNKFRTFSLKENFPGIDPRVSRLRDALKKYIGYVGKGIARYDHTSWWGSNPIYTLSGTDDFLKQCKSKLNKTYIDPINKFYKVKCGSDEIYVNLINEPSLIDNDLAKKFNNK